MRIRSRPISMMLVGLFLWSSACTKWVPLEPPYAPLQGDYDKLQITREGGSQVVLKEPRLESDSVWGTVVSSHWDRGDLKHTEHDTVIPIESVVKIEKRGTDALATVGLAVGIIGVVGLIGAATDPLGLDDWKMSWSGQD